MRRDLERGKKGEQKVIDIFISHGHTTESNTTKGELSFYDIKISTMGDLTIEVKNDEYAKRSGNIAIEVFNPKSNKASGITATKADLWVHILEDEVWITSTKNLLDFTKTAKPHKIVDRAGDNNATLLLYKKEHILNEIFTRIDTMDKQSLESTIATIRGS
jgi:hypothetical protein